MSSVKHQKTVLRVLEETGFAYALNCQANHGNADYAEFASSNALDSFKKALSDPNLTYEQLCRLLRRATSKEGKRSCKTPWHVFMANYIQKNCNSNQADTAQ